METDPTDAASPSGLSMADRGLSTAGDDAMGAGVPFFFRTTRQRSASPPRLKCGCSKATPSLSPRLIFLKAYL